MFSEWESSHIDGNANKNTEQKTLTAFRDTTSGDYNLLFSTCIFFIFFQLFNYFLFVLFFRFCMLE